MVDELEYFSDAKVIATCPICGNELCNGDEAYYTADDDEYLCSLECLFRYFSITNIEL